MGFNHLLNLPPELQIQIFSNLDAVSLKLCARTCKAIYDTIRDSSLLQYTIQLHFDGLRHAGTPISTYSEVVDQILRRRQAWMAPDFSANASRLIVNEAYNVHTMEIVGDTFSSTTSNHFETTPIPTAATAQGATVRRVISEKSIQISRMDPSQDLIVFVDDGGYPRSMTDSRAVLVHIHSITTNDVHPLAQHSPLEFTIIPDGEYDNDIILPELHISGNTLALYFCSASDEGFRPRVLIWDWVTSELLMDSSTSFNTWFRSTIFGFSLLDSTSFFVTSTSRDGYIHIYKILPSRATCVATLCLPLTNANTIVLSISNNSGPIEARASAGRPYVEDADGRLHVFTVNYETSSAVGSTVTHHSANMFVLQRTFSQYSANQEDSPLIIPWAEWGPLNTRIFDIYCSPILWKRNVYGQRVIALGPISGPNYKTHTPKYPQILDFSLAAILSAKSLLPKSLAFSPPDTASKTWVLEPSTKILASEFPVFKEDLETHLPCISYTPEFGSQAHYNTFMIHPNGVVGVIHGTDASLTLEFYVI